jgi:hypothetical protein
MVSRAFGPLKGLRLLFGGCEVMVHGRPEGTPLQENYAGSLSMGG